MGSMSGVSYKNLILGTPPIIFGIVIIFLLRWRLNILSLNEDEAKSLGINLNKYRIIVVIASTMISASVISMCGKVGWIGLLVPQIARMIVKYIKTSSEQTSLLMHFIFNLCKNPSPQRQGLSSAR